MSLLVIRFFLVLLTALALIPAGGLAQPAPDRQACATGEAQAVVGQPYSPELAERARRTAGAREAPKDRAGGRLHDRPQCRPAEHRGGSRRDRDRPPLRMTFHRHRVCRRGPGHRNADDSRWPGENRGSLSGQASRCF